MRTERLRAWFTLSLLLVLTGCFEVPVQERLEISFSNDAPVTVRADVVFAEGRQPDPVRDRLATVRQEYLGLRDPWTFRFARLDPKRESYEWERSQGELVRVSRSAVIVPDRLADLFSDTSISVTFTEREGIAELAMYAGASQRATREQQSAYRDAVDRFSHDVASYLSAMDAVYRYLDAHPDRAVVVFAALVGEGHQWEEPSEDEAALLEVVDDATDRVMAVLRTDESSAYSFEEISSLVNDPFPASTVIIPNGAIVEMEGFEVDEASGGIRVPSVSLWAAFNSLQGHWLSPDPLVEAVENASTEGAEPLSPEAMAAEERLSRPPADWQEVRTVLTERLQPAGTYRARWIVRRSDDRTHSENSR